MVSGVRVHLCITSAPARLSRRERFNNFARLVGTAGAFLHFFKKNLSQMGTSVGRHLISRLRGARWEGAAGSAGLGL